MPNRLFGHQVDITSFSSAPKKGRLSANGSARLATPLIGGLHRWKEEEEGPFQQELLVVSKDSTVVTAAREVGLPMAAAIGSHSPFNQMIAAVCGKQGSRPRPGKSMIFPNSLPLAQALTSTRPLK